jgi:hypothetical protein
MEGTARRAAAEFIKGRAPALLPRVVAEAVAGDASSVDRNETERRLSVYLERRIPPWLAALSATDDRREEAIARLLRMDEEAGAEIPPVVVLGTIAIGHRVIEAELRASPAIDGYTAEDLWAEVDALRRRMVAARQRAVDQGEVA